MATARSRNRSVPVQWSGWRDANPRFDISGASLSADLLLWRTRPLGVFPYVILDTRVAHIFPNEGSLLLTSVTFTEIHLPGPRVTERRALFNRGVQRHNADNLLHRPVHCGLDDSLEIAFAPAAPETVRTRTGVGE